MCCLNDAAETVKEMELLGCADDFYVNNSTVGPVGSSTSSADAAAQSADSSPPRKKRGLFTSYDKHLNTDAVVAVIPSAAAVVNLYCDNLPTLNAQARQSPSNYWNIFKHDVRFTKMHKVIEKFLCPPASSAAVERIFSHGGLFMKPHRARLGPAVLTNLVFTKCNMHLQNHVID